MKGPHNKSNLPKFRINQNRSMTTTVKIVYFKIKMVICNKSNVTQRVNPI